MAKKAVLRGKEKTAPKAKALRIAPDKEHTSLAFQVRLRPELHHTLKQLAKSRKTSLNSLLNEAADFFLEMQARAEMAQQLAEAAKQNQTLVERHLNRSRNFGL
jgi:predicted transcriptional regulator